MERKDNGRLLKHRHAGFKAETVNDDGTFEGYGSVFGTLDSYREIVAPGAFTESLKRIKDSGDPLPALWQHRSGEPIGGYDKLEEDDRGLKVGGWLMIGEIARAREAHALMKRRVVKGLSIGYYIEDESWNDKDRVLTLRKLDLVELSIVTFPANPDALVDSVKHAREMFSHGGLPSLKDFEAFLREAGASKTQAAAIAGKGLSHLLRSESGSDPLALLRALNYRPPS
jgi:uncharacterized protein